MSQDKDRLADALRGMSSNDSPPAIPPGQPPPASRAPPQRPEVGHERSASPGESRPVRPARPTSPLSPARPNSPAGRGGAAEAGQAGGSGEGSRSAVPAASGTSPRSANRSKASARSGLATRRTLIPICLTLGLALPALAAWLRLGLDEGHPARQVGTAVPLAMALVGVALLLLAGVNMAVVRRTLAAGGGR